MNGNNKGDGAGQRGTSIELTCSPGHCPGKVPPLRQGFGWVGGAGQVGSLPPVRSCGAAGTDRPHLSCSSYPAKPCLNGGTCQDSDLGYRCKCPPMYDGPECQQTKHTFGGQGYAWFPPIRPCFQSHISLEFLAQSANGLLLYNGPLGAAHPGEPEDFIAIGQYTDRRWHRLDVLSDGKVVQLLLDQCGGALVNEVEGLVAEGDGDGPRVVVGLRREPWKPEVPECLPASSAWGMNAGPSCGVHGRCLGEWGSFSCDCLPGYTGHKCDQVVPEWSLDQDSVLRYQLRGGGSPRRTHAQFLLRTRASTGTLLSVTSRDGSEYIILEITEGHLSVLGPTWETAPTPCVCPTTGSTGGQWHPAGNGPGPEEGADFQGCLRDVRLNGHSLPLDGRSSEFVVVLERRGVGPGCSSEACSSRPCRGPSTASTCGETRVQVSRQSGGGGGRGLRAGALRPVAMSTVVMPQRGRVHAPVPRRATAAAARPGSEVSAVRSARVKGHLLATLSPSSILAISMCLLVFLPWLVAVTLGGHQRDILNYNEEGGGEQDQNAYDITELKRPLCSSLSQSSSCTTAPLIKSYHGSQEEVHPSGSSCSSGAPYLSIPNHHHHHQHHHHHHSGNANYAAEANDASYANGQQCANPGTPINVDGETRDAVGFTDALLAKSHSQVDFKNYVARILWEADNDGEACPLDAFHVWCVEGAGSSVGSLSSLGSAASVNRPGDQGDEAGFGHDRLSRWGPKFQALSTMYDCPQLELSYRDAVSYRHRSHSQDLLPHPR
ncbi:unnamed protein product [Boreogadus saida]